jgi:hypothetical protein
MKNEWLDIVHTDNVPPDLFTIAVPLLEQFLHPRGSLRAAPLEQVFVVYQPTMGQWKKHTNRQSRAKI